MDLMKSALTTSKQTEQAVRDITSRLHRDPALVLFFASTAYHFEEVTKALHSHYPKAQVVGVTTTGEVGPDGFSTQSLSAQSYSTSFGKVSAFLMQDIEKYPIFDRPQLIEAASAIGIQTTSRDIDRQGLAYVFPVGLKAGEEKMLSVINSIFTYDGFPIFGGTAGDDANFEVTKVSVNGEISTTGGATVFMKPHVDFYIYKENIFEGTGHQVKITKADAEKRIVYEMNNRPATQVYAELIGTTVSNLSSELSFHPLGRKFNDDYLIASPFEALADGSVSFYCQVYEGVTVEILKPKNAVVEMKHTRAAFEQLFKNIEGVLACNCILRKLQFENERIFPALNEEMKQLPNLCGFSSYGEQLNKSQLNQTLLMIGFGTLR